MGVFQWTTCWSDCYLFVWQGRTQINGKPCEPRKEENYLFFLSKCQKPLEYLLSANPNFVQPPYRLNEVQSWVKGGLKKFLILSGDG
jgi:methionyl-tRNA synthetase